MLAQPPGVKPAGIAAAIAAVRGKKPQLSSLDSLRFERWVEGPSVQLLHTGSYDAARMRGKHHEIYLNDPRRTAPERLSTIWLR